MPISFIPLPLVSLQICFLHICLNDGSKIHIWLCHFLALNAFCIFLLPSVNKSKTSSGDTQGSSSGSRKKSPIQGYLEDAIDRNWDAVGWGVERKEGLGGDAEERDGEEVREQATMWECLLISLVLLPLPLFHPTFSQNAQNPEKLPWTYLTIW